MFRREISSTTSCSSPTGTSSYVSREATIPPESARTSLDSPIAGVEQTALRFKRIVSLSPDSSTSNSSPGTGNIVKAAGNFAYRCCSSEMAATSPYSSGVSDKPSSSFKAAEDTLSRPTGNERRGSVGLALKENTETFKRAPDTSDNPTGRRGSGGAQEGQESVRRGSGGAECRRGKMAAQAALRRGSGPGDHASSSTATGAKKGADRAKSGGEKTPAEKSMGTGGNKPTIDKQKCTEQSSIVQKDEALRVSRLEPSDPLALKYGTQHQNFLSKFRDANGRRFKNFTAAQFLEVWNHYDEDKNGYVEEAELDSFLREFVSVILPDQPHSGDLSDGAMVQMKSAFMEAFDENHDGRISIAELAQILPTEENFLLLFGRELALDSSVEFMKVWKTFDRDCSGFIEADELKDFLKALLYQAKPHASISEEKLLEYTDTIVCM